MSRSKPGKLWLTFLQAKYTIRAFSGMLALPGSVLLDIKCIAYLHRLTKKTLKCIQIQKSRYTYINLKLELVESDLKIGIKGKRMLYCFSGFFQKNKMSVNGAIFKSFKAQVNFLTFAWQFDAAKKRRDNCYLLISIKTSSALLSIFCLLFKKCLNNVMSTISIKRKKIAI